jgi:hypothetical protein
VVTTTAKARVWWVLFCWSERSEDSPSLQGLALFKGRVFVLTLLGPERGSEQSEDEEHAGLKPYFEAQKGAFRGVVHTATGQRQTTRKAAT